MVAALWRRRRVGEIDEQVRLAAEAGLSSLERSWTTVEDAAQVDRRARRLLALHLAAALVACDERPYALSFVTLDDRLAELARREGFAVLPSA